MSYEPKPFINIGCGHIILPAPRPLHHTMVDEEIYEGRQWVNVDRNGGHGVDMVVDVFKYPWPFEDDSFDGALLSHIVEHIPHEIKLYPEPSTTMLKPVYELRKKQLESAQDGWYAFMGELYRVLTPGAIAHILTPYGWSQGAITDPTHTRLITQHTFTHSLNDSEEGAPFTYANLGVKYELVDPPAFRLSELFSYLRPAPEDTEEIAEAKSAQLTFELQTRVNVAYEIYAKLRKLE